MSNTKDKRNREDKEEIQMPQLKRNIREVGQKKNRDKNTSTALL